MSSVVLWTCLIVIGVVLVAAAAFFLYVHFRYTAIVARIFEEQPLFFPLRVTPTNDGENVRFPTRDGLSLAGTYFKTTAARRLGVIVFCHEYLGDRWSAVPYAGHLRAKGFDVFSLDFRNHGESDSAPSYKPLHYVTNHELLDLRAALTYLRSRPDRDPAGVALFGVSRGGGTALCVGGKDPNVWGVVTDGAFPTKGTMIAYIVRWAEIYVNSKSIWMRMPYVVFEFLSWAARKRSQARLNCRFPNVERATARLSPRPLLMIHGAKDGYISPKISENLFKLAGEPKELWLVPKAKHNKCRDLAGPAYLDRVAAFFMQMAPRVSGSGGVAAVLNVEAPATVSPVEATDVPINSIAVSSNALTH